MYAKYLINVIARGGAGPSVVAIDVVPVPEPAGPVRLDVLIKDSLPNDLGMIGVSQSSQSGNAPTPLATALVAGLKGSDVQTGTLLAGVQQQLSANKAATVAAQHLPVTPGFLVGAPPPPTAAARGNGTPKRRGHAPATRHRGADGRADEQGHPGLGVADGSGEARLL